MRRAALFITFLGLTAAGFAHPISYKNALSIMHWNQAEENETMVTYTFHRQAAVAAMYHRMVLDGVETKYAGPQFNYLVKRWNKLESQANVYVTAGAGTYEYGSREKSAAALTVEADYETTKIYLSSKFMGHFPEIGGNVYAARYRAGVSAYPFEFDELSSWFIIDVQHNSRMEHEVTVTPVLRLFYKNILLETGSSLDGDWMLNFMVHLYRSNFRSTGGLQ